MFDGMRIRPVIKSLIFLTAFIIPSACFAGDLSSPQEKVITKAIGGVLAAVIVSLLWWLNSKYENAKARKKAEASMSLINCPECGKSISNQSHQCINCGYPLNILSTPTRKEHVDIRSNPSGQTLATTLPNKPYGLEGWLAILICGMLILGPLVGFGQTYNNIEITERTYRGINTTFEWVQYKTMTWIVMSLTIAYSITSAILLIGHRKPVSVKNAICYLWIGGPASSILTSTVIPTVVYGNLLLEKIYYQSIVTIVGSTIVAAIWTAYLKISKRVRNTYGLTS